jgi:hypothetical protein
MRICHATNRLIDVGGGGKVAEFRRVEWNIISDPATAGAALMAGEVDWWEVPQADLTRLRGLGLFWGSRPLFINGLAEKVVRGAKPGARRCSNHRQPAAVWQFSAIVA